MLLLFRGEQAGEQLRRLVGDLPRRGATVQCGETLRDTYPMPTYTPGAVPTEQQVARLESWLVEKQLLDKVYSYHDLVDTSYVTVAEE